MTQGAILLLPVRVRHVEMREHDYLHYYTILTQQFVRRLNAASHNGAYALDILLCGE